MADFVTLTCPSCGGKLQLTNDIERFACGYCGTEHIVRRSGGIVTLAPMLESLSRVQKATDKTASELAIKRLKSEINEMEGDYRQLQDEMSEKKSVATKPMIIGLVVGFFVIVGFVSSSDWSTILLCGAPLSLVLFAIGFFITKGRKLDLLEVQGRQEKLLEEINKKRSELKKHQGIVNL